MIDFENKRKITVKSIKNYMQIPVIQTNQDAPPPKFPYIAYTIITLMKTNNGTYGEYIEEVDGKTVKIYRKEFQQVWSFTVISDDEAQSKLLALKLYDFLDKISSVESAKNEIVIQLIGDITNRDNLLTMGYEYRNGFDVTFAFMNEISAGNIEEEIDTFNFTFNND